MNTHTHTHTHSIASNIVEKKREKYFCTSSEFCWKVFVFCLFVLFVIKKINEVERVRNNYCTCRNVVAHAKQLNVLSQPP